ncbi:MAG: ATP-binding protein [Lentisphaeria bacterium]
MKYLQRGLTTGLKNALQGFPAVMLHGARQVGKTTFLRRELGDDYRYVSLEPLSVRQLALDDPAGFLDLYRPPIIFDEVQYAPGLLPFIKERIDSNRDAMGQYILTGSQNLLMMEQVSETLAGRTAVLQMHPLSHREIKGEPNRPLPWFYTGELHEDTTAFGKRVAFSESLLAGGYPDVVTGKSVSRQMWFDSYIQTYLERDVRRLRNIGDLVQFQNFLKVTALRSGQLFNLKNVGTTLGLSGNTVKAWLSVLEASGLIFMLRPYYANGGKRLVKTPKVYFNDTGLLCHLLGLTSAEEVALSPHAGAIMETSVLLEIRSAISFKGKRPELYFWRTSNGAEVDIVVVDRGRLVPVEVKFSATPKPKMARGLKSFQSTYDDSELGNGWVVHYGDLPLPLGDGDIALPFSSL